MTEPTPAERFNANLGLTNPPPEQQAPEGGAPATEGQGVVAPWGTMHTDPQEALDALNANPDFQAALFDASHAGHKAAIAARSRIFAQLYGDERGDIPQGSAYGQLADGVVQMPEEVTAEQMQAAHVSTAADIIERAGIFDPDTGRRVDPETAKNIAQAAVGAGLSTLDISDVAQAITSGRDYASPEAAIASLGDSSAEIVQCAQKAAHTLNLPQELLNMPVSEHLVLGEHPGFIQWLAKR